MFFKLVEGFIGAATAQGGALPVSRKEIDGIEYSVFDAVPPSLAAMFEMMRSHGELPFIVEDGTSSSFAKVHSRSVALSHGLVAQGVKKGDRVAIFMRNRVEWVISFIAASMTGAVVTPLNSWWGAKELEFALKDSGANIIIADARRAKAVNAMSNPPADLVKILCSDNYDDSSAWLDFTVLETGSTVTTAPAVEILPEDDVCLMYTSGSTGHPKGALSNNRAVISAVFGYAMLGLAMKFYKNGGKVVDDPKAPQLSVLLPIPLFHVTGCMVIFLVSVVAARKLVLMRKWDVTDAMSLIEQEKIMNVTGVPTMTADLVSAPNRGDFDLSSLTDLSAGGAARPADHVGDLQQAFGASSPLAGYGLTETNGIGAFIAGDDYLAHPSSIGKAINPIVELEIRDPTTNEVVPNGERGEICIKSICNIKGYWNQPEATAEAFVDGWLRTGDVGVIDEEGLLYIVDRIKDIIIRGGENIATLEVESAICSLDEVLECSVFGLPDARLGEQVATVICVAPEVSMNEQNLRDALKGALASYKIPTKVIFQTERLPRIATGKIAKKDLRAALL
ncbi:MAG: acyl--CoA ligase [Robiginitomaculum sp.]|nr:acyl--CoA ligase [Robiginitomaculum sp.]